MSDVRVRQAVPEDHDRIHPVLDDWWGRPIAAVLQPLFLDHFFGTSFVADDDQGLAGFLVGFLSPSRPEVAYVHFIGVRPDLRRTGLAADLYDRFFDLARRNGRTEVWAITSPLNDRSIAFHQALGFEVTHQPDGPIRFRRPL
ncbi:GNAT family N-acetyltransferase [Microlunatus parietis]|uniref:GNAT superfamily N-acetyltransferase n=1 Tax=Microlunatus parietis TaxID=682979 RepID=A0A7Y9L9V1_9ACTN|nr:GNAT family N-acetyltransferase [Microlunatus parietis]NYE72179.1 GNAT superfamily N-acetyltransferase [Microlunatus parietis]